jgi:hypothetical protein
LQAAYTLHLFLGEAFVTRRGGEAVGSDAIGILSSPKVAKEIRRGRIPFVYVVFPFRGFFRAVEIL